MPVRVKSVRLAAAVVVTAAAAAVGGTRVDAQDATVPGVGLGGKLVVYSGRAEEYVEGLVTHFIQ